MEAVGDTLRPLFAAGLFLWLWLSMCRAVRRTLEGACGVVAEVGSAVGSALTSDTAQEIGRVVVRQYADGYADGVR